MPVNPFTGLRFLNITSVDDWTAKLSDGHIVNASEWRSFTQIASAYTLHADSSSWHITPGFGVNYSYVMTSDRDISNMLSDYSDDIPVPPGPKAGNADPRVG